MTPIYPSTYWLLSWSLLLVIFGFGACNPDFDEIWQVKDLRILAIQAEPPEVLVDPEMITAVPPVSLKPLVVDPLAAPDALFNWQIWACTPEEINCDLAQYQELISEGPTTWKEIETQFIPSIKLFQEASKADPLQGFNGLPIMIELKVSREEYSERAIKRVVYGLPTPAGKEPNHNPRISKVTLNDQEMKQLVQVKLGEKVKLLPESPADDKEQYLVTTFDGGTRDLTEYLSYNFYVTHGKISNEFTGGKPSPLVDRKTVTDLSSEWTAQLPSDTTLPQTVTFWIVVNDDRGGVGWTSWSIIVTP